MAAARDCRAGRIHVPRWVRLGALPALLVIDWFILETIGQVIFIALAAGLIALLPNPPVQALQRARVPRYVGVFVV
jgi:predicted PurR-regulated permease PerM